MSELKAYRPYANRDGFYHKSDVDKFIAELEESHKKEVGRLRAELEYSTFKCDYAKVIAEKDSKILTLDAEVSKQKRHAKLFFDERNYAEAQLRYQKYKRCLAMAMWCASMSVDNQHNYKNFPTHKSKFRIEHYSKWYMRWLEIAKKFKPNSTAR